MGILILREGILERVGTLNNRNIKEIWGFWCLCVTGTVSFTVTRSLAFLIINGCGEEAGWITIPGIGAAWRT